MDVYEYEDQYILLLDDGTGVLDDGRRLPSVDLSDSAPVEGAQANLRKHWWTVANKLFFDDPVEAKEQFASFIKDYNRRLAQSGKVCTRCLAFKKLSEFGVDMRAQDGLKSICKACKAEENAQRYLQRNKN